MKHIYSVLCICAFFVFTTKTFSQNYENTIAQYLSEHYASLGLTQTDVADFQITSVGTLANPEYAVVYLQQAFQGVKVANTAATVVVHQNQVTRFTHTFEQDLASKIATGTTSSLGAIAVLNQVSNQIALGSLNKVMVTDYNTLEDVPFTQALTSGFSSPLFFQKAQNGNYHLAYEMIIKDEGGHWWLVRSDASNGNILFQADLNLTCNFDYRETDAKPRTHSDHSHTYTTAEKSILIPSKISSNALVTDGAIYNAYPLRVESPSHGERTILVDPSVIPTQGSNVIPSPFGWHDLDGLAGADTNFTQGNNVSAYEDASNTNGPDSQDSFAKESTEGALIFDYPIDYSMEPQTYQDAVITNLFVWNNYIHDIFYAYGFDENNGNFQELDYGRFTAPAGVFSPNGDSVNAEAQDGSGLNNANMATSQDGANPRMQMFLWGSSPFGEFLDVLSPVAHEGSYGSTRFPFVPIPREEDPAVIADIVVIQDDGTPYLGLDGGTPGPSPDTDDGCTTTVNAAALEGNIAIIRRGVCQFITKIENAQNAGAIGVIIVNNLAGDGPVVGGGEPTIPITIPSISLSFEDGDPIIQAINGGETIVGQIIDRGPLSDLVMKDGDVDQGIIAHEYAHGISNRLTGGRERFDCLLSLVFEEQMGEGWSDWTGLITTQELDDTAEQPRGIGTYVLGQTTLGGGIRPARYSTDFNINDYTYGDLPNEEITVPHGVGFIWATILWDLHWAFIQEYGYDTDLYYGTGGNNIATQLIMDGMKLQTCGNVGFVDGRDAIIEADNILTGGENECLIRAVFARRGVGALAIQGTSISRNDQVEDFTINPLTGGLECEPVLGTLDLDKPIFAVFPNPAQEQVQIHSNKSTGAAQIILFDINGRKMLQENVQMEALPKINVSNLPAGIYILQIVSEGQTHTEKLIIQ